MKEVLFLNFFFPLHSIQHKEKKKKKLTEKLKRLLYESAKHIIKHGLQETLYRMDLFKSKVRYQTNICFDDV